ncbi:DUF4150 domain-containing protein [Archangium sp.]|uniref:DUF4150 domain-containing protein n=1 Tax=Archangium sp. TaxID=1872627 RepID=UPI002D416968|nr:DUF4150 domain-containing protein [Archangium sp.]HYO56798.1 DUF4150 domain-containing protein [Archangium sp.]
MGKNVFANGMEIAHEAGMGKVVAAFPDVCLSPPGPPAGPLPVPYPDTSMAKDLKQGSKSVLIGGKSAALKDQSFYKSSPLGNEAATRSFGASVITHQITGKTYFQAWSMDVKFEGKNVCRHLDLTTSNHANQPGGGTPPIPNAENASVGRGRGQKADDKPKCPCCDGVAHPNQVDKDGKLLPTIKEEDYYARNAKVFTDRRDEMKRVLESGKVPDWVFEPGEDSSPLYDGLPKKDIIINKGNDSEQALEKLRSLRTANKGCPNVYEPPDTGCGTHFEPGGNTKEARNQFEKQRFAYLKRYRRKHPDHGVSQNAKVNHKTPLDAGGCPISESNLVPDPVLSGPCKEIDDLQTLLQGKEKNARVSKT